MWTMEHDSAGSEQLGSLPFGQSGTAVGAAILYLACSGLTNRRRDHVQSKRAAGKG